MPDLSEREENGDASPPCDLEDPLIFNPRASRFDRTGNHPTDCRNLHDSFIQGDSAFDKRSPRSPSTSTTNIPPRAEEIDRWHRQTTLENFGRVLNKAAKLVYSSQSRSRYSNVHVLIIKWEEEDPNLPVSYEIDGLRGVLEGTYHYQIDIFEIPDKKSHARVSEKINAFININDDSKNDLKIVYYAGHSRLSKTKDLIWSSLQNKKNAKCSTVTWTGIQKSLEQAESDVLILLDCCSAGIGNACEGNGVTELMSACAYDVEANGVGHYSFTKALTIELGLLSWKPSFSVSELYQNVYCRAQHHLAQGIGNERYPAPIHLPLTRDSGFPRSIQLSVHQPSRVTNHTDTSPSSPSTGDILAPAKSKCTLDSERTETRHKQPYLDGNRELDGSAEPLSSELLESSISDCMKADGSVIMSSSVGDLTGGSSTAPCPSDMDSPWPIDTPRLLVAIRLEDNIKAENLSSDYFADWLRALPAVVREVRVEAGFTSDPSLVMLSLPLSIRSYLPQSLLACDRENQEMLLGTAAPAVDADLIALPSLRIPEPFRTSYMNFQSYPTNLVFKPLSPAGLEAHKKRLDQFAPKVFYNGPSFVLFYEFTGLGPSGGFEKEVVIDDATLKERLGDQSTSTSSEELAMKKDPKCRFIFIKGEHSCGQLPITRKMLVRILTYHQVMPSYLEFLFALGSGVEASDLTFTRFLEQTSFMNPPRTPVIRNLGRSGCQLQLGYNLKSVSRNLSSSTNSLGQEWFISQAAFYHQFDVHEGTTLWIVTHGYDCIEERVTEMTTIDGRPRNGAFTTTEECFRSSLSIHLLYCQWSIEDWHGYIKFLEETNLRQIGEFVYTSYHLQLIQRREDKINETIMVIEANVDAITSLRNFYKRLIDNKHIDLKQTCEDDVTTFTSEVDDIICNLKLQIAHAKILLKIIGDRRRLILQHHQHQASNNIEDLTSMTIKIGSTSQKETASMRVITLVTLIFLPGTFVSTLFSTDIIKYNRPGASDAGKYIGSFSYVYLFQWLLISTLLTISTIAIGWCIVVMSRKASDEKFRTAQLPTYAEPDVAWKEKKNL